MALRTLGTLALEGSDFRRPKPLLLLCYLALEGPKERRFLAELFWPSTTDSLNSLSKALTRLRQGSPSLVEADTVRVWTTIKTDAQKMLGALEREQVEQGLELYKGPFLEGVYLPDWSAELEEWLYTTREFFAERVRVALLQSAESAATRGEFKNAAKHAETAYRLPGNAGLEPDELERTYKLLLAGENPYTREVQKEIATFGLAHSLTPDEARALYTINAAPEKARHHNLPTRVSFFVGRSRELNQICQLLIQEECRLITVTGAGGSGKTSLAREAAYRCLNQGNFKDGTFLISLESLTSAETVASSIAETVNLAPQARADPLIQLQSHLRDKTILLILDNFEHLTEASTLVSELLNACPHLKVLTTSRVRLALAEEWVLPLDGLSLPTEGVERPEEALTSEAVQLFVRRAKQADVNFVLNEENVTNVAAICRLLNGYPLGIEMAAVWVRFIPCSEIAGEIERNLDFLQTATRNVSERHRSIRAVFEHSWKLLTNKEQAVLRQLAVFRESFRREAAAEVTGVTIPLLASLIDKSLLYVAPSGRYSSHPLLHQFAKEKLAERPEEEGNAQGKHGAYYLRFLQRKVEVEMLEHGHQHALEAIEEELGNINAAWHWMVIQSGQGIEQRPMMLTFALQEFYDRRGRYQEGIALFNVAVTGLHDDHPTHHQLLGNVLVNRAYLFQRLARYEEARNSAQHGLDLLRPFKEMWGEAIGVYTLGLVAQHQGDVRQAEAYFQDGLRITRALQDKFGQAGANSFLYALGAVRQALGDYSGAEQAYREVLSLGQSQGNHINVVRTLNALGNLFCITARPDEARGLLREALQKAQQLGFQDMVPQSLIHLGALAYDSSDYHDAQSLYQKVLDMVQKSEDEALRARAYIGLGNVATAQHDFVRAQIHLVQALTTIGAFRGIPVTYTALRAAANLRAEQGQLAQAASLASFVLHQPTAERYERDQAQHLLNTVRDQLSSQVMEEAVIRAKAMGLEKAIEVLLYH